MAYLLEGDGLLDAFYHYIWLKEVKDNGFRGFFIPDTVVYKYQQPRSWYFTSIDGTIKKKCKDKLTAHHIKQAFLRKVSDSGIVASFIYISNSTRTVEFFGVEELKQFLSYGKKAQEGILQKFVDPKDDKNTLIQMVWSPKICMFEYRGNLKDLYDLRYDMYERAVTFEGEEFHSRSLPIRGKEMKKYLQELITDLVEHIAVVSKNKIKINRMVLHFKLDINENLWFLRATSIRCANEAANAPLDLNSFTKLPETINSKKFSVNAQTAMELKKTVLCRSCEEAMESGRMFEISYKMIINSQRDKETPPLISKIHPNFTHEDFKLFKYNPIFLNKQTLVCDRCFLLYTKLSGNSGAVPQPEVAPLWGTQPLEPYKTQHRRESTSSTLRKPSKGQLRAISSVQALRTYSGGEFEFNLQNFQELPRIPNLDIGKPKLEQQVTNQKSLAKMLGGNDISSFLQEIYARRRRNVLI